MLFTRSQVIIVPLLILLDAVCVGFSLYAAYHLRFFSFISQLFPIIRGLPRWTVYAQTLYFAIPLMTFIFLQHGLYKSYFVPLLDELIRIVRSVTLGLLFLVLASFFYRDFSFSRMTLLLFWGFAIAGMFTYREIFKIVAGYLLRRVVRRESVLIVGEENRMIKSILKQQPHFQVYYLPFKDASYIERMKELIREKGINQVILVNQNWDDVTLMNVYDWCENQHVELKIIPDIVQLCRGELRIDSSLGIPIYHMKPVSFSGFNFYFKRVMDIVVSICVLSFIWPILLIILVLIKIDSPGPYLYRHKRMGYRGRVFDFYKFRTMVANADVLLEKLQNQSDRQGPVFKMANDPRVTKFGRFLRRFSIDELLQLFNVLKGDMSLVGPRPQVLWEAAAYDDWAKRRLRVLPGITGLWQVSGRANLSYEEMIELDIYYIENWTPGLDIKILLKTMPAIFGKTGAY